MKAQIDEKSNRNKSLKFLLPIIASIVELEKNAQIVERN